MTSSKWNESKLLNVYGNVIGNVYINSNEAMNLSLELEKITSAGVYGNNISVPIMTIDEYGRIRDISYNIITGKIDSHNANYLFSTRIDSFYITTHNLTVTERLYVDHIISSNSISTDNLIVYGNLKILGTSTIINSNIVEVDDNIIILNADGELLKQAGISANIGSNFYNFVYDICSNSWTTQNNNLSTNKLTANTIVIKDNITVTNDLTVNGNLTVNRITSNVNINSNWINDVSGIKFSDETTITTGSITSSIDERFTNYLFNKPDRQTDPSGSFKIINDNTGSFPTITLEWSNPTTRKLAFLFGTTPGYNRNLTGNFINDFNSSKNITHLPYSKELKIQFCEENNRLNWSYLSLNNNGMANSQYIIPNTVTKATLNSSNEPPTLIPNTVTNTYTEFKSGKGLQIGKKYQFRIYLTNEITEEDGSYNYLYIPSETEFISFGGYSNITAPTEILFPENSYHNLQIKGINANIYAETGMNTPFPIPDSYSLSVRYGFDIDISANINSKQMTEVRQYSQSGNFKTDYLKGNNFIGNITPKISNDSLQISNGNYIYWYPEFDYNVSNFFMEANLDIVGNIAQTTIGNNITTIRPSRTNIGAATIFFDSLSQEDYTSVFSSKNFGMTKSNIYRYGYDNPIDNIYILDNTQTFDLSFNPNIKVINNSIDYIGLDSINIKLSNFTSNIVNYDNTVRFNDITNDSEGFLKVSNINSNANIIVSGTIEDGSTYNSSKGYYTDIELSSLGVKNINLSRFPDISNNNYHKYRTNINQNVNIDTGFENKGTIYFDFGVAEKSTNDISFNFNLHSFTNLILNNNFYGIPRPNTSYDNYIGTPTIVFMFNFYNVNNFWRRNLKIIENMNVKLMNQSISSFVSPSNIFDWTENIYNLEQVPIIKIINNDTWNIIANSTNNNNFSRLHVTNTQFNITFNVNNNIGFSNTLSHNADFNWDNSNDVLWWDYTWGINNIIPSNDVFSKPPSLTIQLCESINPFTSGNTIPNLFNHDNKITYETAMWSKDGWCGANITLTNDYNPYIDYRQYNLITDISYDYLIFDNSGTQQTVNYGLNVYSGDSTSQTFSFSNLKWVILKLSNDIQNTNDLQFDTNLAWLTEYIVFYLEEDYNRNNSSYSIFENGSTITSYKTNWLDVQNTSINSSAIINFISGQSQNPVGSNNGCNKGDSGENLKRINRFRAGNSLINQYLAFGIKPGKKLKTISFLYV